MVDAREVIQGKITLRQQKIAELQREMSLLAETLRDIQGSATREKTEQVYLTVPHREGIERDLRAGSLTDMARSALKEAREFLTVKALLEKVQEKKPEAKESSMMSGVYALARIGRFFVLKEGKVGLLEWEKTRKNETIPNPPSTGWGSNLNVGS